MTDAKPCCAAAAARMVKKLVLPDGSQVGIVNMENILREIADLKLANDNAIKKELLRRVKIYNYVAPTAEADYSRALLGEYNKLFGRQV
jgi:hypothetical protein